MSELEYYQSQLISAQKKLILELQNEIKLKEQQIILHEKIQQKYEEQIKDYKHAVDLALNYIKTH